MFTCYRAGINIFSDTPEQLVNTSTYLSSAAARRNKEYKSSKVWAGCRLAGILRLSDTAFVVHFTDDQGLQFQSEMSLFHKLVAGRCETTACIYAADSYRDAAYHILNEPPLYEERKRANGWRSFREACKNTRLPLFLLECSDIGALQLRVMNTPGYRDKVTRLTLGSDYAPPPAEIPDIDALWNGTPLAMAADMDIKRLSRAYGQAKRLGMGKLLIAALPEQMEALGELFRPTGNVDFFGIPRETITKGLHLKLYEPSFRQSYETTEGVILIATDIPNNSKAGGTGESKA